MARQLPVAPLLRRWESPQLFPLSKRNAMGSCVSLARWLKRGARDKGGRNGSSRSRPQPRLPAKGRPRPEIAQVRL